MPVIDLQQPAPSPVRALPLGDLYLQEPRDISMRDSTDVDSPSKKRKREEEDAKPAFVVRIDPKQATDASLRSLRELLESIFEAEDQLQPDTSGAVSTHATEYFDDGRTLGPDILIKVEKAMARAIADCRFQEIQVDDVNRLQKICQVSLNAAESIDMKVRPEWTDTDVESWLHQIETAEKGLRSLRTMLKTMTGGRVEKQLYSEEMIGSGLAILRHVLDDCIVPIVELRSSGSSSDLFKSLSSNKKNILGLVTQASRVFSLLTTLLAREEISDEAVNTIEAISIALVFVENGHSEKDSVLGIQKFERLRVLAVDAVAKIFSVYSEQRISILDDILTSLEKLPVTRQSARQFKLLNGHSIQLVSALLMILVQTSASKPEQTFGSKESRELPLLHDMAQTRLDDEDGDDNQDNMPNGGYPPNTHTGNGLVSEAQAIRNPRTTVQNMLNVSSVLTGSAQKTAHYVVQFMVSRALKSTKSGDTPYRNLLDIFTEDFILVLDSPDWPASELMLRNLLTTMIGISATDKSTAPAKNMALDLIGPMGSAISNVLSHSRGGLAALNASESEIDTMLSNLGEDALEGKANEREMLAWTGPYHTIIEHLKTRESEASHIQSARGYQIAQWATNTAEAFDKNDEVYENADERSKADGDLAAISHKVEGLLSNDRALDLDRWVFCLLFSRPSTKIPVDLTRSRALKSKWRTQ
jgi:cohesin loading factor subunit SCC2